MSEYRFYKRQAQADLMQSSEAVESQEGVGINEKNLIAAIIERAVLDYAGTDRSQIESRGLHVQNIQLEAKIWLRLDQDAISPMELLNPRSWSFVWCCDMLDLCPLKCQRLLRNNFDAFLDRHKKKYPSIGGKKLKISGLAMG